MARASRARVGNDATREDPSADRCGGGNTTDTPFLRLLFSSMWRENAGRV